LPEKALLSLPRARFSLDVQLGATLQRRGESGDKVVEKETDNGDDARRIGGGEGEAEPRSEPRSESRSKKEMVRRW
jgi:hypothetical protein